MGIGYPSKVLHHRRPAGCVLQGLKGVLITLIRDLEFELDDRQMAAVEELFMKGFAPDQVYFSLERRFRWGLVNVDIIGS